VLKVVELFMTRQNILYLNDLNLVYACIEKKIKDYLSTERRFICGKCLND